MHTAGSLPNNSSDSPQAFLRSVNPGSSSSAASSRRSQSTTTAATTSGCTTHARVERLCDGEVEVHVVLGSVGVDQNLSRQVGSQLASWRLSLRRRKGAKTSGPDAERASLSALGVPTALLNFYLL